MKQISKYLGVLLMLMISSVAFVACSDDDDEENGGGGSSTSSIVGKSYTHDSFELDGDDNPQEYHTQLTFTSSTTCKVRVWGYEYIWSDGYKKRNFNETKNCSYTVSASKITLKNYPFYAFGGDLVLTNHGGYLEGAGNRYYKD